MFALLDSKNELKLWVFSANCSSGQAMIKIEERWDSSWGNNLKQAQLSDDAGLEFQLPIARWIGCAGATLSFVDFAGEFPYFRDEVLPRLEETGLRESYE